MNPKRRTRLQTIGFIFGGSAITLALAIFALQSNLEHFYLPHEIVDGTAPLGKRIRAGGMVVSNSVVHDAEDLRVRFELTDLKGASFEVVYEGLLPGLFREGQGTVVVGTLLSPTQFEASQVLAKHDENYVPPELEGLVQHQ